eukprot:UN23605
MRNKIVGGLPSWQRSGALSQQACGLDVRLSSSVYLNLGLNLISLKFQW